MSVGGSGFSQITATVDRFEGEEGRIAVLVEDIQNSEPEEPEEPEGPGEEKSRRTARKADVDRALLPEGSREGDVIRLSRSLGEGNEETVLRALSGAEFDRAATEDRRERVRDRIERLKDREDRGEQP